MNVKFAVIGQGHIGKRHAAMIRENQHADLVAVCDVLSKESLGLNEVIEPFYFCLEDLLIAHPEVDVVNICTPNGLHAEQAICVLEAKKHVLIEKPIALTKFDAERILAKSIAVNRNVFCVMQNRYSPTSIWLKELVESNILGDVYLVQTNCFWNRDERYYTANGWHGDAKLDGGTLFTQYSHFVDIMYWLFGDMHNFSGRFLDFNHQDLTSFEDSGIIQFDFKQGGAGVLTYSTAIWNKNFESNITVIAQYGSIRIGGTYMNEVEYCHVKGYTMPILAPSSPPNDYGGYSGSAQNHHYVIENVIDKLKGEKQITTNVLDGLKVVSIIEQIYQVRGKQEKINFGSL